MASDELTTRILRDIRSEIRGTNERLEKFAGDQGVFNTQQLAFNDEQRAFNDEQRAFNDEQRAFSRAALNRFDAIETTLQDLAEQMVMMSRAVKLTKIGPKASPRLLPR